MNSSGERKMIDEFFGGLQGTFLGRQRILDLPLGYPADVPHRPKKRKPLEEITSWNGGKEVSEIVFSPTTVQREVH
ncbi:MAG: hypothetical protein ACODAD_10170 [Planctomycetota bacterium]